jgi:outer membrane usher protein
MIRYLITASTLAMLSTAAHAAAAGSGRAPAASTETQSLFVELIVNGKSSETIVPLLMAKGGMTLDADILRSAGIPVANEGPVDVTRLERVRADYDVATQTLHLDVAPELLPVRHVAPDARDRLHTVADYGAMLNYDAYVQRSGGTTSASLWSEQRLFGPLGTLSNSGTIRIASGRGARSKGICVSIHPSAMSMKTGSSRWRPAI